ncbi:hypothetical protein PtA15_2A685 [Puccinia triticina]|uniref:BHLH domain-containing protein n=1 Tax=Puccinia triticina TaxID=208348 RepID=A0ABY7CBS9_9BASI|nr:uncharacterized protein PtA15_2A685 [Puccinia triticina]WAQ82368.1 hypothetical protein PtA15_2A685 [Puccinia triticina]WAR53223.1 hypothetical protein PtB15_2B654 [Puccinia triticina]
MRPSRMPSPILSGQVSQHAYHTNLSETLPHEITPVLSPSMTPLSTFSTSSYPSSATISDTLSSRSSAHPPFQSSNHQLEFFSPLTSPALRPLGHHDSAQINRAEIHHQAPANFQTVTHAMPALIDQAATLGLSAHQSFMVGDRISASASASQSDHNHKPPPQLSSQTHLTQPASTIFLSQSNFIPHPDSVTTTNPAPPIPDVGPCQNDHTNQSPILHPHHSSSNSINMPATPSTSSTKLSGRQRPSRSSKSRPSPLIRPLDKATEICADRSSSAKRARSLTGASVSMSPSFPSGLAKMGLADSPSPIDMQSRELNSISSSSSSVVENPATSSHALPAMPPPQALSSIPSNPNEWRLQPMTPASLFNFEKPLAAEAPMGKPTDNFQGAENGGCGKWKTVEETSEYGQRSGQTNQSAVNDQESAGNFDKCLQVEQPSQSTGSSRSGSKEKTILNSGRSRSKDTNPKRKKNGANKVRLDSMATMNDEEEGPEHRRSSHKVAEQRRRDSLKMCFEDLRHILPPIQWNEKEEGQAQEKRPGEGNVGGQRSMNAFDPSNPNKGMSKVALLRRSNEYILRLKERLKRRDGAIEMLVQMLADQPLGSLSSQSNAPQKTQEAKEADGPNGGSPSRPSTSSTHGQLKAQDALQALEDSFSHGHNQEVVAGLRTILNEIRMEKQEDKDDHRLNHSNHTDRRRGSFSGEELD